MAKTDFFKLIRDEVARLDGLSVSKRHETIIEGFSNDPSPRAIIAGKKYLIFNSNDYLGLRHNSIVKSAEEQGSRTFGSGPGAVRFISGSLSIHRDLEAALAKFHDREDAMVFSSAFAANLAVISSLIKGQSKDSLVDANTLVISDELNHRSIVEGIRVANLPESNRRIFPHFNLSELEKILSENAGKYNRVLIVTDGVFSMLGEYQDLAAINRIAESFDSKYSQGVLVFVDDCHGVGVLGSTGRGTEEITHSRADVLVGTLGKAFGADGGYVVGSHDLIDYLRESCATYIYSNSISPGTASAATASVNLLLNSQTGPQIIRSLHDNIALFKTLMKDSSLKFSAESEHAIQPLLLGDASLAKALQNHVFNRNILVTSITYPVVPKGRDEIRIQLSASHTPDDIRDLVSALTSFSL